MEPAHPVSYGNVTPDDTCSSFLGKVRGTADKQTSNLSSLSQGILLIREHRREQIADDPTRASLYLDRDRHAGGEVDELSVDLHLRAVE
jgi:hypothetical protein